MTEAEIELARIYLKELDDSSDIFSDWDASFIRTFLFVKYNVNILPSWLDKD